MPFLCGRRRRQPLVRFRWVLRLILLMLGLRTWMRRMRALLLLRLFGLLLLLLMLRLRQGTGCRCCHCGRHQLVCRLCGCCLRHPCRCSRRC